MKSFTILLVCVCLAVVAIPAFGQNAATGNTGVAGNHGIPGFLDPRTGSFKPMRAQVATVDTTTAATQGTIIVGLIVNLVSTFPSDETFVCGATADVFELSSGLSFEETATVAGSRNGSTLTCMMTIPYLWRLTNPAQDSMTVSFSVQAQGPSSSGGQPTRGTFQTIVANYPIPAQYRTTTFHLGPVL